MFKVEIRPDWVLRHPNGQTVPLPVLLELLAAVRSSGSISQAAKECGISYRHAWGLLNEFNEQFGAELVHKSRGSGTVLSPLADKLIWADKRIAARLSPMLDSLASELQQELASLLDERPPALRLTASHGFAVAALVSRLEQQGVLVDLQYRSSTEAVAALARGECDLAGFHLPVGDFESAAAAKYRPLLDPGRQMLIHLAYRMQGIFTAKGNPKDIRTLDDLARSDVRFVNRQRGSGTRLLLELLLNGHGIAPDRINGFESAEFTHAAVAAYVATTAAPISQPAGLDERSVSDGKRDSENVAEIFSRRTGVAVSWPATGLTSIMATRGAASSFTTLAAATLDVEVPTKQEVILPRKT
eukprot:gene30731-37988_t